MSGKNKTDTKQTDRDRGITWNCGGCIAACRAGETTGDGGRTTS